MLTFNFSATVQANYVTVKGLADVSSAVARSVSLKLTDGTAAGQADGIYTADTGLAGGSVDAYYLATGLRNMVGDQVEFTAIKFLMLEADIGNTSDLVMGGGTWLGPFNDASDSIRVKPGSKAIWETEDANGWPVDPAADMLQITCDDDALYKLTVVGVSSALSLPAAALHPEIVGVARVGTPVSCTSGDYSGDPVFSYQWLIGGSRRADSPANPTRQATYTPIPADLGKTLARITYAANVAGTSDATTKPVTVLAALIADGVLDFTQPGNPAAAVV